MIIIIIIGKYDARMEYSRKEDLKKKKLKWNARKRERKRYIFLLLLFVKRETIPASKNIQKEKHSDVGFLNSRRCGCCGCCWKEIICFYFFFLLYAGQQPASPGVTT